MEEKDIKQLDALEKRKGKGTQVIFFMKLLSFNFRRLKREHSIDCTIVNIMALG